MKLPSHSCGAFQVAAKGDKRIIAYVTPEGVYQVEVLGWDVTFTKFKWPFFAYKHNDGDWRLTEAVSGYHVGGKKHLTKTAAIVSGMTLLNIYLGGKGLAAFARVVASRPAAKDLPDSAPTTQIGKHSDEPEKSIRDVKPLRFNQ